MLTPLSAPDHSGSGSSKNVTGGFSSGEGRSLCHLFYQLKACPSDIKYHKDKCVHRNTKKHLSIKLLMNLIIYAPYSLQDLQSE